MRQAKRVALFVIFPTHKSCASRKRSGIRCAPSLRSSLTHSHRSVPGYWRNSTQLFCYREDCKGVPLSVLDFDDDSELTTTWNDENTSPPRLHARVLSELRLPSSVQASDVFGAVLALLTSSNETRWNKRCVRSDKERSDELRKRAPPVLLPTPPPLSTSQTPP